MTVLGGDRARRLGAGGARSYLVGMAAVVIGLSAAFGLSRLIVGEGPIVYDGPIVERSLAMQDSVDALWEGARAQTHGGLTSSSWTLEQELAQIQAGGEAPATGPEPATQPGGPR